MTDEIVAFLRERLDEDEQVARAVTVPSPWTCDVEQRGWSLPSVQASDDRCVGEIGFDESAVHIARHDPARVLADVEAKRRIVEEHEPEFRAAFPDRGYQVCGADGQAPYPCTTLRLLALPFADHPSFREEWKP